MIGTFIRIHLSKVWYSRGCIVGRIIIREGNESFYILIFLYLLIFTMEFMML